MKIIVAEGQSVIDRTGKVRRGGMTAEVSDGFLERNPLAGRLAEVGARGGAAEVALPSAVVELPIEGTFGALPEFDPDRLGPHVSEPTNGPLVEKLVKTKKPRRGRKPKKTT